MASFGLSPAHSSLAIDIDVKRPKQNPLIVHDGPIESETWTPEADFPGEVRLYGRVWTGGPRVVIRYYSARLPDGNVIPFCAVVSEFGHGLSKVSGQPGRPGSATLEYSYAAVRIVDRFP